MTKDEVMNMNDGQILNALVAEKIMGWRTTIGDSSHKDRVIAWPVEDRSGIVFEPSTDIATAWVVLTMLRHQWTIGYDPGGWGEVRVFTMPSEADDFTIHRAKFDHPKDAPLAICKAAILATLEA